MISKALKPEQKQPCNLETLTNVIFPFRNVPFMCSDSELRDIFKQFGRVRYGRLVLDPDTEMCRGKLFT